MAVNLVINPSVTCSNTMSAWLNPDCGRTHRGGALEILTAMGLRKRLFGSSSSSPVKGLRVSPKSWLSCSEIFITGFKVAVCSGVTLGTAVNVGAILTGEGVGGSGVDVGTVERTGSSLALMVTEKVGVIPDSSEQPATATIIRNRIRIDFHLDIM